MALIISYRPSVGLDYLVPVCLLTVATKDRPLSVETGPFLELRVQWTGLAYNTNKLRIIY